jgi:hypothetical protein
MADMNRLPVADFPPYPRIGALLLLLIFTLWSATGLFQPPLQAQDGITVTCAAAPAELTVGEESRWSLLLGGVDGSPLQSMAFVIDYPADSLNFQDSSAQSQGINLALTREAMEILGPLEITENQVDETVGQIRFSATRQLAVSVTITESSPFTNTAFPLVQIDLTAQEAGLVEFTFQGVALQDEGGETLDVRVERCLLAVDVPMPTATPTISVIPTEAPTPTPTATISVLPTVSILPTATPTWTFTPVSPLATPFPTATPTETWTPTWTPTPTETWTPTFTPTPTVVVISTPTPRTGQQQSPLSTPELGASEQPSPLETPTPTPTPTDTATATVTPTEQAEEPTPAPTEPPAITPTPTSTPTPQVVVNLTPIPEVAEVMRAPSQSTPASPSVLMITDSFSFLILGWVTLIGGALLLLLIWILRRT